MVVLKNILVATDFSEPSGVALAYGRDLARSSGATMHVLHVLQGVALGYGTELGFALPDLQAELEKASRRDLDNLLTADDRSILKAVPIVETHANIANGVTEYARKHAIDLVIVGTHGRGAVKHLLVGSVAERVVRTAPCPVLTVRAVEREFIAPEPPVAVATT
jgi:nucleotide-binding universal stress UspA family protein